MEVATFNAGTGFNVLLKDKYGYLSNKKEVLKCGKISVRMCKHAKKLQIQYPKANFKVEFY